MPTLTIRDVSEDILCELKARAALHGRSIQAEVSDILAAAVHPVRMGDSLWKLGREIGLTEPDVEKIENGRDRLPARPIDLY